MKRILLTGMSGTGKSTVISALRAQGYRAIDMDEPGWSEYTPDGDWIWCEERIQKLLSLETEEVIFVSGCATNQVKFYPLFDTMILLSAPAEVLLERLLSRTNNPYGKHPHERAAVLGYLKTVEPLLRQRAGHEIDTRAPLDQVVATIVQIAAAGKTEQCCAAPPESHASGAVDNNSACRHAGNTR